ncbi:hypothetical protein BOX15_Mlig012631g1 [Macrostomum lignano]|uniref:AH domain-containing protein n=1 Tax=Macrostomum lignano TaxID=282301 RepID=A0A267G9D9_9PLAT|nr:hypothetical protein BOX15_Mlig012631g1 [Macrostomum lignano]
MSGYSGSNYDRYVQRTDNSTTHKIRSAYWTTKQAVMQKLGRPEDEHVVASDSELDAKLDLFRSVQKSCADLLHIIERYQESVCALSQAENELGRFLKSKSGQSAKPGQQSGASRGAPGGAPASTAVAAAAVAGTSAAKMMAAVGKSLSFSAQQRLALRVPLGRLYQEVETFRYRAITDTSLTIQRMEATRTDYRGALLWMKKVSEELDPDTFKQLDKFRSVQAQVRKSKEKFDKLKLDSMQKVDLLAASRCNMLSHVLALYQDTLMQFWAKTSRTMSAVADSFKGYQFYEFSMLKDLVDESRKLADKTAGTDDESAARPAGDEALDQKLSKLDEIFMREFRDESGATGAAGGSGARSRQQGAAAAGDTASSDDLLGSLIERTDDSLAGLTMGGGGVGAEGADILDSDDSFLQDLLGGGAASSGAPGAPAPAGSGELAQAWLDVFGSGGAGSSAAAEQMAQMSLLEGAVGGGSGGGGGGIFDDLLPAPLKNIRQQQPPQQPPPSYEASLTPGGGPSKAPQQQQQQAKASKKAGDMSAWLNMFAELDPLANPDLISKKSGQISDA